jgi:hypothetical protein
MSLYDSSVRPESKSTQIWTPPQPYYADESKYLAILDPYPPNANLDLYPDQRALVLWLASRAGKEVLRTLFHKSSVSSFIAFFFHQRPTHAFHKVSRHGRRRGKLRFPQIIGATRLVRVLDGTNQGTHGQVVNGVRL